MNKIDNILSVILIALAMASLAIVGMGQYVYDHGHKDGYTDGYKKANQDVYDLGYKAGYEIGANDGYEQTLTMVANNIKEAKERCHKSTYRGSTVIYGNKQEEQFEISCAEIEP